MRDLSAVRRGWEEAEQGEAYLTSRVSLRESFRHWLQLQATFESQLRETSALFGPERASALADLQARLRRLGEWQERHGDLDPIHPGHSAPASTR